MSVEYPPHLQAPGHRVLSEADAATLRRALWLKRVLVALCVAVLVLVLAVVSVTVLLMRASQVDNTGTLEAAKSAAEAAKRGTQRIEDCTTPERPCFDRGQHQLADTVAGLNRYGIIVASCSSGPSEKTVEEITECVLQRLPDRRR